MGHRPRDAGARPGRAHPPAPRRLPGHHAAQAGRRGASEQLRHAVREQPAADVGLRARYAPIPRRQRRRRPAVRVLSRGIPADAHHGRLLAGGGGPAPDRHAQEPRLLRAQRRVAPSREGRLAGGRGDHVAHPGVRPAQGLPGDGGEHHGAQAGRTPVARGRGPVQDARRTDPGGHLRVGHAAGALGDLHEPAGPGPARVHAGRMAHRDRDLDEDPAPRGPGSRGRGGDQGERERRSVRRRIPHGSP